MLDIYPFKVWLQWDRNIRSIACNYVATIHTMIEIHYIALHYNNNYVSILYNYVYAHT